MNPKELSESILVELDTEEKREPRSDMDRKASGKLRDSYMGRIPDEDRAISVKFAWHELWSKVINYLSKEELMTLGEALVVG